MIWIFSLALKSTVLLAAALALAASLRRASSSTRHTVWTLALAGLLIFPALAYLLPRWEVPVLPPSTPATISSSPRFDAEPVASYEVEELAVSLPAEAPAPPPARVWTWREAVVPVWLFGAAFGIAQLALGTLLIALTVRRARTVVDEGWRALLAGACARLGLTRRVELRETGDVPLPVVWGYRRPVILLPRGAAEWPLERKRAFLLHELSHVARYDCFTQTLAYVVRALYWPHPLVWWAVASLRREAERACDDRVVAAGTEAPEYAQHLLEAARSLPRAPRTLATASAVIERTSLGDRLLALLDDGLDRGVITGRALVVTTSASLVAVAVVAALQPVARAAVVETIHAAVAAAPSVATATPAPSMPPPSRPTPRATASTLALHGTVKGPDGKPIEKALVVATGPRRGLGVPGQALSAHTNAAGEFRIDAFAGSGPYEVRAAASGLAGETVWTARPGVPMAIVLGEGFAIEGAARDAATRKPIAGAVVTLATRMQIARGPEAGPIAATTDTQGRYRLSGLSSGAHEIVAGARGYRDDLRRVAVPAGADFTLRPGGASIVGIVKGTDGAPLAGALIHADLEMPIASPIRPATTDVAGRFELSGMEHGTYRLLVRHPRWAPILVADIVAADKPSPLAVTLPRPYRVVGRLVSGEERPVKGYVMVQALEGSELPAPLVQQLVADASADGRFQLEGVPPGALTLALRPLQFAQSRAEITVGGKDPVVDVGDLRVELGHVIRGRVHEKDGRPVSGARVYVPAARDPGDTVTEADGSFVMAGVRAGTQGIAVSADGFAEERRRVDPDGPPIDVVLQPEAGIAGSLVDGAGRAVAGAVVISRGEDNTGGSSKLTESDGRFKIGRLPVGTYSLLVQPREHLDKPVKDVKVEAGRTTDVGRIVLESGATVRGVVVDGTGAPVPAAQVVFQDPAQQYRSNDYGQVQRPRTDAQGRFELRGLAKGVAKLSATHPGFAAAATVEVDVDPDTVAEARLSLLEGARVTGSARERDGRPVANAFVTVSDSSLNGGPDLRSPLDADGTFSVEHVAPGRVSVVLMQGGAGQYFHVLEKQVEVRDGETASVDLTLLDVLVSGRLTRGGRPLARHSVRLSTGRGGGMYTSLRTGVPVEPRIRRLEGETKDDGTYELIAPGPGRYQVLLRSLLETARGGLPRADDVVVPDVPAFRHDIALPDWSLIGKVTAKDTRRALERASVAARPASGEPGGASTSTDEDGRFRLALEPGRYVLRVHAPKYVALEMPFDAGSNAEERGFELVRGGSIRGRASNPAGSVRAGVRIAAIAADGGTVRAGTSEADGTFSIEGVSAGAHVLFASDGNRPEFALHAGALPGDSPVALGLTPGAAVRVAFKDARGNPLGATMIRLDLVSLGGVRLGVEGRCAWSQTERTDASGVAEYYLPSGDVAIIAAAQQPRLRGEAKITVPAGIPVSAEVHLTPRR